MFRKFLQNTHKPDGLLGRIMLSSMNVGHKPLSDWAFGHLHVQKNAHVLDLGCGGGANIAHLLKLCPDGFVEGLDYSPESVAASQRKNHAAVPERCRILQGDACSLPYDDETFDLVTAFETVYFWQDIPKAFYGVLRVLKPSGEFMIVCEMDDPKDTRWTDLIEGMRIYSSAELQSSLESAGFVQVTVRRKGMSWICIRGLKPRLRVCGESLPHSGGNGGRQPGP